MDKSSESEGHIIQKEGPRRLRRHSHRPISRIEEAKDESNSDYEANSNSGDPFYDP